METNSKGPDYIVGRRYSQNQKCAYIPLTKLRRYNPNEFFNSHI